MKGRFINLHSFLFCLLLNLAFYTFFPGFVCYFIDFFGGVKGEARK